MARTAFFPGGRLHDTQATCPQTRWTNRWSSCCEAQLSINGASSRAFTTSQNAKAKVEGCSLLRTVEEVPSDSRQPNLALAALAFEGVEYCEEVMGSISQDVPSLDPYDKLAIINNCAALLLTCRNFAFYHCWGALDVPQLHEQQGEKLLSVILSLSKDLIEKSNIPGFSFLFPLRVAGTFAATQSRQEDVIHLLRRVHNQGFVFSRWVQEDLNQLWRFVESS